MALYDTGLLKLTVIRSLDLTSQEEFNVPVYSKKLSIRAVALSICIDHHEMLGNCFNFSHRQIKCENVHEITAQMNVEVTTPKNVLGNGCGLTIPINKL